MLSTLAALPQTDQQFYNELSTPRKYAQKPTAGPFTAGQSEPVNTLSPAGPASSSDEPPFSEPNTQDDCEAIPTAAIIDHICNDNVAGRKYREDDGVLSLAPTKADQYGPCDSDSNSEGDGSEFEDHASDGDWVPTAAVNLDDHQGAGQEFNSFVPPIDEQSLARIKRARKPVDLDNRFRFWQEK